MSLTNVMVRFTQLGAEWVMWVLLALSVVSIAVTIERAIYFWVRRIKFDAFLARLESLLRAGDLKEAQRLTASSRAPECVIASAGLAHLKQGAEAVSEAMQSAKARERLKMESYLAILATLGNNAPFVGLLGTVLGIIKASHDLAAAQAAKQVASTAVMAGVFEALVATAVGLFVAIPAVVAYNFFQRRLRTRMGQVDATAHLLLSMHGARKTGSRPPEPPRVEAASSATEPATVGVS